MEFIGGAFALIFMFTVIILYFVSWWKVLEKAGRRGWEGWIPFYNIYILVTKICKLEIFWFILCLIPYVNIIAVFRVYIELAKKFGQGIGFGIGLALVNFIFLPILAFGDYKYTEGNKSDLTDHLTR